MGGKKIYIIRHGETHHNRQGIIQGRGVNSVLNDLGKAQANSFFEAYKDVPLKKVYTSTLSRTIQTVQQFLELGLPHEALPGLDELSWGHAEGKVFTPETDKRYYGLIDQWREGLIHLKLEGGENPVEVAHRQKEAMDYIVSKENESPVLVCMHGRALKIMLAWLMGKPLKDQDHFAHDNLSLYILNYENGCFTIDVHNERSHVEQLRVS